MNNTFLSTWNKVYSFVVLLPILLRCSVYFFNSLRPRLNRCPFADDIFKRIFLNENVRISINISLKFVPKGLINNIPALVLIMAWRRPGDKPFSEPMLVRSLTHICVTRPQWVKFEKWGKPLHMSSCILQCIKMYRTSLYDDLTLNNELDA